MQYIAVIIQDLSNYIQYMLSFVVWDDQEK